MAKRIWHYGTKFAIALGFAAGLDVALWAMQWSVPRANELNRDIEYGLESVNVVTFVSDIWHRLDNRYHWEAGTWSRPFNLTIACRDTKAPGYAAIRSACVTQPRPDLEPGSKLPPSIINQLPFREIGTVDQQQYPRRWWLEMPLGVPDAVMHAVRCAWQGIGNCEGKPAIAGRSNWVGRLMLLTVVVLAVIAAAPFGGLGWSVPRFVAAFVIGLVLWAVVAFAALLAFDLLRWLSRGVLQLTNAMVAGMMMVRPGIWVVHAVKDVAADRAKHAIEQSVT